MIDYFSVTYDNHIIIGDFNLEPINGPFNNFMYSKVLHNLVKGEYWF